MTEELMNLTNSSSFQGFPLCYPESGACLPIAVEWTIILINIITAVVNVLHLFILSKITRLRATAYGDILKMLAVTDVYFAIPTTLQTTCALRAVITYHKRVGLFLQVLTRTSVYIRLFTLSLASLERLLAIYRPFRHGNSNFVRYIWLWFILCWVASSIVAWRDLYSTNYYTCMDTVLGISNCTNFRSSRRCVVAVITLSIISTTFLVLVRIQLCKMNRVAAHRQQAPKDLKKAAFYILTIVLIFYLCFTTFIIDGLLLWWFRKSINNLRVFALLLNSIYGLLNTFVYGWISPAYQRKARQLWTAGREMVAARCHQFCDPRPFSIRVSVIGMH